MKNIKYLSIVIILGLVFMLCSCGQEYNPDNQQDQQNNQNKQLNQQQIEKPNLPKQLNASENQEPNIKVYIQEEGSIKEMPFEEYVAGVVGGEIKNDWPEESIKAQAIIARTFVLKFIDEKGGSKYEGAQVSTDIEEAQAWDTQAVNERVKKAVNDTRGMVICYEDEFANTFFHSNSGGKTATPKEGLNYKEGDLPYIKPVKTPDVNDNVPEDERNWTAEFSRDQVINAANEVGANVQNFETIAIGQKGPSGRAVIIKLDDKEVSAPELRIALDSKVMKSTLLDEITMSGDKVIFKGRGYGHGVGMSQWAAYKMAEDGKNYKEIINYFFKDTNIVKMWE